MKFQKFYHEVQNLGLRCVQVPSLEAADVEAEACAVVPGPPDCKPVGTLLKMVSDFPVPSRDVRSLTKLPLAGNN
jgi:hypothetical protein